MSSLEGAAAGEPGAVQPVRDAAFGRGFQFVAEGALAQHGVGAEQPFDGRDGAGGVAVVEQSPDVREVGRVAVGFVDGAQAWQWRAAEGDQQLLTPQFGGVVVDRAEHAVREGDPVLGAATCDQPRAGRLRAPGAVPRCPARCRERRRHQGMQAAQVDQPGAQQLQIREDPGRRVREDRPPGIGPGHLPRTGAARVQREALPGSDGTGLSVDLIDEMARRGTALVPTMINIRTFGDIAQTARAKFPGYSDHMIALRDRFPTVVRAAHEAGVPIYVGTDAGGGIRHGLVAEEMLILEEAGLPATDVLAAASWKAREWLGFPGLVEGGLADLVVYPDDPRRTLAVTRHPHRIVLRGRIIR